MIGIAKQAGQQKCDPDHKQDRRSTGERGLFWHRVPCRAGRDSVSQPRVHLDWKESGCTPVLWLAHIVIGKPSSAFPGYAPAPHASPPRLVSRRAIGEELTPWRI